MKYLKIKLISKFGRCPHNVGDEWEIPYALMKPDGLCDDAHYSMVPYLSMAASGGKSWEKDGVWKIHCPSKSGVVFEIIPIIEKDHEWPVDMSWANPKKK
ncbi:MAG: TIGR04076 family protein [Candidatus Heimdallarchaeota archaeon]|nr:TIGR04076 family protein [Candidatus Heimdallarchaeota archaeon]